MQPQKNLADLVTILLLTRLLESPNVVFMAPMVKTHKNNKTVTNNTVQLKLICLSFYVKNIHIKQKRGGLKTRMQYFLFTKACLI